MTNLLKAEYTNYSDRVLKMKKVVINTILKEPIAALEEGHFCTYTTTNIICHDDINELYYLLGIINTHVGKYLWTEYCLIDTTSNKAYSSSKHNSVSSFPMPFIGDKNASVKRKIIEVTKSIHELLKSDPEANYDALQGELEDLVWKLYSFHELPEELQTYVRNYKTHKTERMKYLQQKVNEKNVIISS